jgi:hypothetical protein
MGVLRSENLFALKILLSSHNWLSSFLLALNKMKRRLAKCCNIPKVELPSVS